MAGQRAHSRITLRIDVIHDGDPHVLGEHVAVEATALLDRWGCDTDAATVEHVEILVPGDDLSAHLPAIGATRRPATPPEPQP